MTQTPYEQSHPVTKLRRGYSAARASVPIPKGYKVAADGVPVKSPFASLTQWTATIGVVAGFFPPVQQFVVDHPQLVLQGITLVFGLLRWITKGKIELSA